MAWVVLFGVVVALVVAMRWGSAAHTRLRLAGGRVTVIRGRPSPALREALEAIAREAPALHGEVSLTGRGDRLEVGVEGLGDGVAQRIRNAVFADQAR